MERVRRRDAADRLDPARSRCSGRRSSSSSPGRDRLPHPPSSTCCGVAGPRGGVTCRAAAYRRRRQWSLRKSCHPSRAANTAQGFVLVASVQASPRLPASSPCSVFAGQPRQFPGETTSCVVPDRSTGNPVGERRSLSRRASEAFTCLSRQTGVALRDTAPVARRTGTHSSQWPCSTTSCASMS